MKIVTWNINGLRSLKKSIEDTLKELDADIACFQETKISRSQLQENVALVDGYTSYFSFSRKQSGYSGVATYCKNTCTPVEAEEGLSGILKSNDKRSFIESCDDSKGKTFSLCLNISSLDSEGRAVITRHEVQYQDTIWKLVVLNVYCPCVDPGKPERKEFKMQYLKLLEARVFALLKDGYKVIIVGDLNIAHQPIDHCDPGDEKDFSVHEARQWLSSFLTKSFTTNNHHQTSEDIPSFIDVFRFCHPQEKGAFTCWNTLTGARQTNFGTRIDYILLSHELLPVISSCEILSNVFGSDHCPVSANISCSPISSDQLPSMCTRLWPEFAGLQQKLSSFLQKTSTSHKPSAFLNEVDTKRKSSTETSTHRKKNRSTNSAEQQKTITSFFTNNLNSSNKNAALEGNNQERNLEISEKLDCASDNILVNNDHMIQNRNILAEVSQHANEVNCNSSKTKQIMQWKTVLRGLPPPPLCSGHGKVCVLRTVKKEGPNFNRQFYTCSQPNGHISNPETRCNYFKWITPAKHNVL